VAGVCWQHTAHFARAHMAVAVAHVMCTPARVAMELAAEQHAPDGRSRRVKSVVQTPAPADIHRRWYFGRGQIPLRNGLSNSQFRRRRRPGLPADALPLSSGPGQAGGRTAGGPDRPPWAWAGRHALRSHRMHTASGGLPAPSSNQHQRHLPTA
jgi:hypothetical protein